MLLAFAIKIAPKIKSTTPKIEPKMIPISAAVLSFDEVSIGLSSSRVAVALVVDTGVWEANVLNGIADDWNETESATNVRPSAKVTEKFPLVTNSLNVDSAVDTFVSPGPPGSKVNETTMLPGRTLTLETRDAGIAIASAIACVTLLINSGLLESVMMAS